MDAGYGARVPVLRPAGLRHVGELLEPPDRLAHRAQRDLRGLGEVAQAHPVLLVENDEHELRLLGDLSRHPFGTEPAVEPYDRAPQLRADLVDVLAHVTPPIT